MLYSTKSTDGMSTHRVSEEVLFPPVAREQGGGKKSADPLPNKESAVGHPLSKKAPELLSGHIVQVVLCVSATIVSFRHAQAGYAPPPRRTSILLLRASSRPSCRLRGGCDSRPAISQQCGHGVHLSREE
mmetsp:Transcript_11963/g.23852  ORF Transcript_11963/g.23852 Transcript_11963/m.23852 type:complete len:130 (-) Transcript_11963:921-1310(-)